MPQKMLSLTTRQTTTSAHSCPASLMDNMSLIYKIVLLFKLCQIMQATTVREIDGTLTITESLNTVRMVKHAQLWASDLRGASNLDVLLAGAHIRELTLLTDTISKMTGVPVTPNSTDNTSNNPFSQDNQHLRYKRNILGQLLKAITGVATTEDLQQSLKVEEEMKNKITSALSHQTSYEKVLSASIANISRETETLLAQNHNLAQTHHRDKKQEEKLLTHYKIFMDDVEKLEDIIHAVWTGTTNTRHATYLSSRAGLQQVANFRYLETVSTDSGPSFRFTTRLYRNAEVMSVTPVKGGAVMVETTDRLYHLHPSQDLTLPLTEQEVTGSRSPCADCALLVHIGNNVYKTYQSGAITCRLNNEESLRNLTIGQQISIPSPTICLNRAVQIGGLSLRIRTFNVDTSRDKAVDVLLLRKDMDNKAIHVEDLAASRTSHDLMNLRLAHDLATAGQDIDNLVLDNSYQVAESRLATSISAGWLIGVTVAVLGVISLIIWRYCAIRKMAATALADTHTTA
jgi:hypothetical protein